MAPSSTALALIVLLAAPAFASEKAEGKKPAADGHKPAAAPGKSKAAAHDDHESGKGGAKGDHAEHGAKAKPKGQAGHDDHGSKTAKGAAASHAEKEPKGRTHGAEPSEEPHDAKRDSGKHKDGSDAPRRARLASGTDLHAVTQRLKDKIVEIPRFRSAPARPAPIMHARPAPKTELVWRQGLSWPPSLDAAWERPFVDGDASVNLSWAMDDRCAAPTAEPELPSTALPSTSGPTVAGLAPSRCCGLFLTK